MELNIKWDKNKYEEFTLYLKSISDVKYKEFQKKLTPTKYEILGIRLPILRHISKEIFKGDYKSFLKVCKSNYYEEVMIKLLVIAKMSDIDEVMKYFYDAIYLIDNWALCDTFCNSLKIVGKNKEYFLNIIKELINSSKPFNIRVGLILLLSYYVEEDYLSLIYNTLDSIKSEEYYVNMASSWLLCEVFVKFQASTLKYLEHNNLNKFIINKGISKIRDSYRVDKNIKDMILKYKRV